VLLWLALVVPLPPLEESTAVFAVDPSELSVAVGRGIVVAMTSSLWPVVLVVVKPAPSPAVSTVHAAMSKSAPQFPNRV